MCDLEKFEKYIGLDENWNNVEWAIIEVIVEVGMKIIIELGEVVFYGFKFDFMVKDVFGCFW